MIARAAMRNQNGTGLGYCSEVDGSHQALQGSDRKGSPWRAALRPGPDTRAQRDVTEKPCP